eukprot:Hpha_TRINITY_DN16636_c3_g5::TRINITY_DN16636_c3_g5_i1::g.182093::m.182093
MGARGEVLEIDRPEERCHEPAADSPPPCAESEVVGAEDARHREPTADVLLPETFADADADVDADLFSPPSPKLEADADALEASGERRPGDEGTIGVDDARRREPAAVFEDDAHERHLSQTHQLTSSPPPMPSRRYVPPLRRAVSLDGGHRCSWRARSNSALLTQAEQVDSLLRILGDGSVLSPSGLTLLRRTAVLPFPPGPITRNVLEQYYAKLEPGDLQRDFESAVWLSEGGPQSARAGPVYRDTCTDGCLVSCLKEESVVNDVFFRPPLPHYDAQLSGLVFIPTRYSSPRPRGLPEWLPCQWTPTNNKSRGIIVFCHGNACDIQQNSCVQSYARVYEMSVLSLEWPGYGLAGGFPTERNLAAAVLGVVLYLVRELGVETHRVVLYARSLATGPCTVVAAELERQGHPLAALVLKSAYTSWKGILESRNDPGSCAGRFMGCVTGIIFDRFQTAELLKKTRTPTLILHGAKDTVIPVSHAHSLYAASACQEEEKTLLISDKGCHDYWLEMWHEVSCFLQRLPLPLLPLPTRLPRECYRVTKHAERSFSERRWQRTRKVVLGPVLVCLFACGSLGLGVATVVKDVCGEVDIWLLSHAGVLFLAAGTKAFADWTQDDLERAQDECIVGVGVGMLVLLILLWLGDLAYGSYALFRHGGLPSDCPQEYWYSALGLAVVTNYLYLLKTLVFNK